MIIYKAVIMFHELKLEDVDVKRESITYLLVFFFNVSFKVIFLYMYFTLHVFYKLVMISL